MIDVSKLREFYDLYQKRSKKLFERETIGGFIEFVHNEQQKKPTAGVISLKQREAVIKRKEWKERLEKNKPLDPDEDFNNLPS